MYSDSATNSPAVAQTWEVTLNGRALGTVAFEDGGEALAVAGTFAGTPLGVADGTYRATSRPVALGEGRAGRQFVAESAFTTESRNISVLFEGDRAVETVVLPASEATELSDPADVPAGALDPARAFALLARSEGCPGAFLLYDGRRVAEVSPQGEEAAPEGLACRMRYGVALGPAHMSPLGIRGFDLVLLYGEGGLRRLAVRAGPFELALGR